MSFLSILCKGRANCQKCTFAASQFCGFGAFKFHCQGPSNGSISGKADGLGLLKSKRTVKITKKCQKIPVINRGFQVLVLKKFSGLKILGFWKFWSFLFKASLIEGFSYLKDFSFYSFKILGFLIFGVFVFQVFSNLGFLLFVGFLILRF